MKPQLFPLTALVFACGTGVAAQMLGPQTASAAVLAPAPDSSPASAALVSAGPHLTAEQMDQLLGPIALYPDALIALIFPSATESSDVVLAARYLAEGGDEARIDDQPWDDSVKALAHYPDLVKWMDENLAWTKQVGEAFLDQPAEVMKSVQRLRTAAKAAGTLVDTPQQQVVSEGDAISIVPSQPDVIYLPYYDPGIVYLPRRSYYYPNSFLTFSAGFPVGFWLGYNLDWGHRRIWVVDRRQRERFWREQHDWRRPAFSFGSTWNHDPFRHVWNPNPVQLRPSRPFFFNQPHAQIAQPAPIAREAQRLPAPHVNASRRSDRVPGNRGFSRTSPNGQPVVPAPAMAQTFQPAPVLAQVQSPAPASTPPPALSRGNRGPQSAAQGSHENRSRTASPDRQIEAPASNPAPSPQPAAPQTAGNSQPVPRASHPQQRTAPVASVPQTDPSQSSSQSSSEGESRRGRQSRSDRRD